METHAPRYYSSFHCLGGACPHTCCAAGWEIPVDPATVSLYETMPGTLGDRVRAFMEKDPEGEPCFPLRGGVCPFLNGEGLCHIHIALGEEATPLTCRTHPRFCYEYGPLRERGLCASCPEVARLILGEDLVLTDKQEEGEPEEAPPLLAPLLAARNTAFSLLAVEDATLGQRLQVLLLFANEVQILLDENRGAEIPSLCQFYAEEFPLLEGQALPPRNQVLKTYLELLEGLAILHPQWKELLSAGKEHLNKVIASPPQMGERSGAYFLYRHWLRGVWDGDVLTWAEFAILGVAVISLLSPLHPEGYPEVFRLFCEELEHSEENLERIQDFLWEQGSLGELLALADL